MRCQKMVEIHGYNENISVTREDDNPCHATLSDSMNSVLNYSNVGLFMVSVVGRLVVGSDLAHVV